MIIGRNLELLAVADRASRLFGGVPVVYECLDIHRLLLNDGTAGKAIRRAEAHFGRNAKLILTSSPAFIANYFVPRSRSQGTDHACRKQGACARRHAGSPAVPPAAAGRRAVEDRLVRGAPLPQVAETACRFLPPHERTSRDRAARPARLFRIRGFRRLCRQRALSELRGAYKNPEDLSAIYNDVHFSWAIDFFEEGLNSSWLLPNRLYEGCLYGSVPIALAGTETARFLSAQGHRPDAARGLSRKPRGALRRPHRRAIRAPLRRPSPPRIAEAGSPTAAIAAPWSTTCPALYPSAAEASTGSFVPATAAQEGYDCNED